MRGSPSVARRPLLAACGLLVLAFTGCQEIQGPVWSPDGTCVAYTSYVRIGQPGARMETNVYLVDPDDENGEAVLLARHAAFPRWVPEGPQGPQLYLLGHRNAEGFYTSLLLHRKLGEGALQIVLQDPNLKLVGFQLSADGVLGLLCSAKEARPGAPQTLDFVNLRDRVRTPLQLGEVLSPALSPNGRVLAYAQKAEGGGKPSVAVLELDRRPLQPKIVFPSGQFDEPTATAYVVHAFPDSDRFLFYSPTGQALWTVRRDGKSIQRYALPMGYSAPLIVVIAEDGKSATLTVARPAEGGLQYEACELVFAKGNFSRLAEGGTEFLGGHAPDPRQLRRGGAPRWAWLSPAGLAIGTAQKARFYPQTGAQGMAASGYYVQQQEPQKAVAAALKARELKPPVEDPGDLGRAEARAYREAGEGARAAEAYERAALLYPVGKAGLPLLFPPGSGLPQQPDTAATLKEMEALALAAPNAKIMGALRSAYTARVEGKSRAALDAYLQAIQFCAAEELVGGMKFQAALAAFENGELTLAGEHWESAARCPGFPQADYAAGLAAIAYKLDTRPGAAERADAALKLGLALNTPLREELQRLPNDLRDRTYRARRTENEVKSAPAQGLRAWVEVTEFAVPQAFLKPSRIRDFDGNYSERRIAPRYITLSELQVAGLAEGTQCVARLPLRIGAPLFSADGQMLAFLAQGEVFPLPDSFCEVYVVNLKGAILYGSPQALLTGRLSARTRMNALSWTGPKALQVSGANVDVFGNETQTQKAIAVTPR